MVKPLRICLVSSAFRPYPSGLSEHVYYLALNLHRAGHAVTVLTTDFARAKPDREPFTVVRCGRALRIPMNGSFATLPVGLRLKSQVHHLITAGNFDIVHCHGLYWPEISYWALRYSRAINLVTFVSAGFRIRRFGAGLYRRLFRKHLGRIHARIAVSHRARLAAEPYVPGHYHIIPCGVDLERFRPDQPPPQTHAEFFAPGRRIVLFVGRLDRRKGIDVLLKAFALITQRLSNVWLAVIGNGPLMKAANSLARRLDIADRTLFVGEISPAELPNWYACADLYCSPALGGETLGIVLLEAMASGTPVIASRIPGYSETIRDGIDGLLFQPGDPVALSHTALRILTDSGLSEQFRRAGRARAARYAWPVVCAETLKLYAELLASKPSARASNSN